MVQLDMIIVHITPVILVEHCTLHGDVKILIIMNKPENHMPRPIPEVNKVEKGTKVTVIAVVEVGVGVKVEGVLVTKRRVMGDDKEQTLPVFRIIGTIDMIIMLNIHPIVMQLILMDGEGERMMTIHVIRMNTLVVERETEIIIMKTIMFIMMMMMITIITMMITIRMTEAVQGERKLLRLGQLLALQLLLLLLIVDHLVVLCLDPFPDPRTDTMVGTDTTVAKTDIHLDPKAQMEDMIDVELEHGWWNECRMNARRGTWVGELMRGKGILCVWKGEGGEFM